MEAISLAFSAVALASLFSLCVQCFELIEVGKNLGSEGELLIIKLSIEKRRLMIWGEAVGILRPDTDRDPLLDDLEAQKLVERILDNIRQLFAKAESLKAKYGLEAASSEPDSLPRAIEGSSACLGQFQSSSIVQFHTKLFNHHGKAGFRSKTKWAIRDSKKFAELVQNLKELVDGLSHITISTHSTVHRGHLIRQETESIPDLQTLKIIETTCSDQDWRSSASVASEYFNDMNKLTPGKRQEISDWMTGDYTMPIDQGSERQWQGSTKGPPALRVFSKLFTHYFEIVLLTIFDSPSGGVQTEVLVLCSTATLKAYLPHLDRKMDFHPVASVPEITGANRITASRMMKAIIVPPQIRRPSITIYCPPRMRYVHMALTILDPYVESAFRFQIRFDDRLLDEYTAFGTRVGPRMVGYHRDIEDALYSQDPTVRRIVDAVDMNWLEQRIDVLSTPSYTPPTKRLDWYTMFRQSRDDPSCVGIIVMAGEAACWDIFNIPPVMPPEIFKEGRVFRLRELERTDLTSSHRWKAEHYCNISEDKNFDILAQSGPFSM